MKPKLSIFNNFPFVRLTIVFILGIVFENTVNPFAGFLPVMILTLLAFAVLFSLFLKQSIRKDRLFSALILITLFMAGFTYAQSYKFLQFREDIPVDGLYSGIIRDKVPAVNNRFKYTVKLECVKENNNIHLINEKILLYSSDTVANAMIEPGCEIYFWAHLYEINNNNNPGEFDFKKYMSRRGIRYQASVKQDITLSNTHRNTLLTIALNIRTKLMSHYRDKGIDGDEYAVLGALTLGDQNYISNEVKSYFASSGAMHVLSVSGLHVGIIFIVLNLLFKPMDKNKKLRGAKVLLLIGFLWIYAFLTGLSPSVLRSTSMFSFLVIGENFNHRTNTYNTLAVSAFLLLLLNPLNLFDVGFQLSYLAVLSILFFQPRFSSLIKTNNVVSKYVWDMVTVSLAAQLGTSPVSIYYFNQFPSYFLLSNMIVVPAAAIILYLGMLFFALSFIPYLSDGIAILLKYLTTGLNYCVKTIETLPGSVIEGISISLLSVFLLYLFIASLSSFLMTKKGNQLILSLSTLVLLIILNIVSDIESLKQQKLIIYNSRAIPLISYIDGKNHYYYSNSATLEKYSSEMLKCASEKYRTHKAVRMSSETGNEAQKQNRLLIINGIPIYINENTPYKESKYKKETLSYYPAKSLITIDHSEKFIIETIHDAPTLANINQDNIVFNLKKEGALVLNLR